MIHGLRNNKSGALAKYVIAQKRLKMLHYNYPVVGYSYDSNTAGVQYKSTAISALKIGIVIAKKNGRNLSKFILDMKAKKSSQKIRLIGHSLGAQVILSTVQSIAKNPKNKNIIESIHKFFFSIIHKYALKWPQMEPCLYCISKYNECERKLQILGRGGRIRTYDLWVMSPTSYQTAPPRTVYGVYNLCIIFSTL